MWCILWMCVVGCVPVRMVFEFLLFVLVAFLVSVLVLV